MKSRYQELKLISGQNLKVTFEEQREKTCYNIGALRKI